MAYDRKTFIGEDISQPRADKRITGIPVIKFSRVWRRRVINEMMTFALRAKKKGERNAPIRIVGANKFRNRVKVARGSRMRSRSDDRSGGSGGLRKGHRRKQREAARLKDKPRG
ncbi:hypothetical protein KSP39_PZI006629 [Platanthera zijinensis]|uniref:Uncharacterized protein n=1 Tax=Platanthera zijinensis TaxID=2320716 RepID=A0AAP0GA51_9ASPA